MSNLSNSDHQALKQQKMPKEEETIAVWTHQAKQSNNLSFQIIREALHYLYLQITTFLMPHQPTSLEP